MINILERLVVKKQIVNDCWIWSGAKDGKGYGMLRVNGKVQKTHRLSYQVFYGVNPGDMQVCHTCDTPSCFKPSHLFLGTNRENSLDMVSKGRSRGQKRTHCSIGHELAGKNLYVDPRGYRECRQCRRDNVRRHRAIHGR